MRLFARPTSALIGVDITSSAVKVLELSTHGARYRVEHYAIEPLPQGVVADHNFTDIETVGEAIKRAVARSGSKAKRAIVAVAGAPTITKLLPMPDDLDGYDLESQIQLEATNHIPFPIDEVLMDFEIVGKMPGAAGMNQVLLAAARSDTVNARTDALELAGLIPAIVDVEPFAIERAVGILGDQVPSDDTSLVALVDIGAATTTLHVLRGGKILYTRDQPFGGRQLTDEIVRRQGLSQEDVYKQLRAGRLFDGYEDEVLLPFQEAAAQTVSRLLQFFYAASEHNQVHQIGLVGGVARLPGLDEKVADQLGIETQIINPLAHMTMGSRIQAAQLAQDAPALLTVAGLAMRVRA